MSGRRHHPDAERGRVLPKRAKKPILKNPDCECTSRMGKPKRPFPNQEEARGTAAKMGMAVFSTYKCPTSKGWWHLATEKWPVAVP